MIKERLPEMQKNTFVFISVACFIVLCFVTFLNTYRVLLLEAEVQGLRESVEKCNQVKPLQNEGKLDQLTRERRSSYTKQQNITSERFVKHLVKKSLDSNEFNTGSFESEFPLIRDEGVTRRTRLRMQTLDERHPRTGRIKPLPSIHFSGDTSRYVLGTHQNFKGNGHLKHVQSIFVDWVPAPWVGKTGMMSHFEFNEGYLTIRESGLYFVYAQIYYLDEHDLNGYRVYKNGNTILQCTISLHSITRAQKGNTCYTAGVEYVAEGDKISLGDILTEHYSLFEPGKSFFGVIKLGDVRARN